MALGLGKSQDEVYAKELQRTSSLKKCAICDLCGRREKTKQKLVQHLNVCVTGRTCSWCNIVFKNRGNLYTHTLHIHGKMTSQMTELKSPSASKHACTVCSKSYTQITNLKYHRRREHYNMIARIIEAENRDLNDVWWERVLNSDAIIQIRKVKRNMYLMKKATMTSSLEISEPKDSIDLSPLYPTHKRRHRVWCDLCNQTYYQRDFNKHINERHNKIKRHECNNCKRSFTRSYHYLKHKCSRKFKLKVISNKMEHVDRVTVED